MKFGDKTVEQKLELWSEEEWFKYLDAAGDDEEEVPPEVLSLSL